MPYDLCLFDLDGTLIDPKPGITKSFQYALAAYGIHEELDDLVKFIGPPLRESFKVSYGFSESDTERAVAKYREYFAEKGLFEASVYPFIPEALSCLKENGKLMAVVTNKVKTYASRILDHFMLSRYFITVFGDELDGSLTINGKGALTRAAISALDPERKKTSILVGDRKHDIIGAQEAGIDSAGVTWGYGTRAELEGMGATWIVDSIEDLLRLTGGYKP
ncbi:MAG: HAD hydrolase-like protein [Oscillospiraceae bacterium]|nr:HAD hydrolase-like protein [Oscillospiraceae bacterium]